MLKVYNMAVRFSPITNGQRIYAESFGEPIALSVEYGDKWVRYDEVEPLLKRLAELEAKEQEREQFERECG